MSRAGFAALAALLLAALLLPSASAQDPPKPPEEPPAPAASPAVVKILDEAQQLLQSKKFQEALAAAERAMAAAREGMDAPGEARAHRMRAQALAGMERPEEAVTAWQASAAAWERAGDGPGRVEALAQVGLLLAGRQAEGAPRLLEQALVLGEAEVKRPLAAAAALDAAGVALRERGRLPEARRFLQAGLALRRKAAPESLAVAASLNNLGIVARQQSDLPAAREYYQRALAIQERLAPGSLAVAASLGNLGVVADDQGDPPAAREYHQRALAIQERLAPGSLDVADSLSNLGVLARRQGDLPAAREYLQRALAIQERLAPGSLDVAASLNNLGVVAWGQGDLPAAREYHQRALAIRDRLAPGSLAVAASLGNLGNVASNQGDVSAAREYYQRALAIHDRLAPGSLAVAASLNNLGNVASNQGDLPAARDYHQRALAIRDRLAPGSLDVAASLNNLGSVAYSRGDLSEARECHQRALAIREKLAPGSLDVAASLNNLGVVARQQGDVPAAREYYQRALAMQERLAPGSLDVADSLSNLGNVARHRGERQRAADLARRAWAIVRSQGGGVVGDEARQAFYGSTAFYASHYVRDLLRLRDLDAAFRTLEAARAQALEQLLLERGVNSRLAGARIGKEYREALALQGRAYAALGRASLEEGRARRALEGATTPEEQERLRAALEKSAGQVAAERSAWIDARDKTSALWIRIKKSSPRVFPRIDAQRARRSLPPGSLFLAFLVGEEATTLFLVRPPARRGLPRVLVFTLPTGERTLVERTALLRQAVLRGGARVRRTRALFALLFPPAAAREIASAKRLVISPDGPLWELPFAALLPEWTNGRVDERTSGRRYQPTRQLRVRSSARPFVRSSTRPRYLGLEKPITYAQSLTLFAQARGERPRLARGRPVQALVLGDLAFSRESRAVAAAAPEPVPRGERALLLRDGALPGHLPATGPEARRIASLYGGRPLTGEQGSEAALRRRVGKADVVHLATHGYLNPYRAMSSMLLLTAPEKKPATGEYGADGFLEAWEIQDQLALRAEVVVLSACETGRGENVRAEGLVGLTRALQVAGARSVVASQWQVADASTAALMVEFHRQLRRGVAKDEALRRAMLSVAKLPAWRDPFYWAPFVLLGDPDNPNLGSSHFAPPQRPQRGCPLGGR